MVHAFNIKILQKYYSETDILYEPYSVNNVRGWI